MASRGTKIIVKDRDEPIAQLGPVEADAVGWRERWAGEGRLRRGSQDWGKLQIKGLGKRIDIQASLRAVREDPSETPRPRGGRSR
jgi:hypothetical protein